MTDSQIITFLAASETGALTDAMNLIQIDGWMSGIYPLGGDMKFAGRAFTVEFARDPAPDEPVYNIFEIIERARPGDVMVLSVPSDCAIVGENIMNAVVGQGLSAMVLDGMARDTGVIRRDRLPLFCRGSAIRLETGCKITRVQGPVVCGGARVNPGDYVVGDSDGVIAIASCKAEALIYQTERIVKIETELEYAIRNHLPMKTVAQISSQKKTLRIE